MTRRRSYRMRILRSPLSQPIVRSTTHRTLPNPLPCGVLRFAMTGSIVSDVRKFLRAAWHPAHVWEVEYHRNQLRLIADVRSHRADGHGNAVAIHHQRMFGACFPTIDGAGTGPFSSAKRPD